jgi:hypothetical protein
VTANAPMPSSWDQPAGLLEHVDDVMTPRLEALADRYDAIATTIREAARLLPQAAAPPEWDDEAYVPSFAPSTPRRAALLEKICELLQDAGEVERNSRPPLREAISAHRTIADLHRSYSARRFGPAAEDR